MTRIAVAGDIVLWCGYKVRLTKFVHRIDNKNYWYAESLYRADKAVLMYCFLTEDL